MQEGVVGIEQSLPEIDRRVIRTERRRNNRKAALHSLYRNRRKHIRREIDKDSAIYVDVHEPVLFYLAITLMTLSVFDAFFTTLLLEHGSEELNPLLAFLLDMDLYVFLGVKFTITAFSILFFIMHKHHRLFNIISCYHLLIFSVVIYTALVFYEINMIRHLPLY